MGAVGTVIVAMGLGVAIQRVTTIKGVILAGIISRVVVVEITRELGVGMVGDITRLVISKVRVVVTMLEITKVGLGITNPVEGVISRVGDTRGVVVTTSRVMEGGGRMRLMKVRRWHSSSISSQRAVVLVALATIQTTALIREVFQQPVAAPQTT